MAKSFDPRIVLKHIANPLLREFFARRGELADVPWDELTEHKIEPIFAAWQSLPEAQQLQVQVILRDINELADHRGVAVLIEEIQWRCPERIDEFNAQQGKADKAMWMYLNVPEAFEEAAMFARADALAAGRYWEKRNGLPKTELTVDDAMKQKLAGSLTGFYGPVQLRGRYCQITHYPRAGGAHYLFAYLDDYPDKHMIFDDNGETRMRADRYAFENVFVYNSDEGTMELYAPGGTKVRPHLETAFCEAMLGIQVEPADPLRPSYQLNHLLTPNFPLATEPADGIEEARILRLRIVPRGSGGYIEIKADPKAHPNDIYHKIERWLRMANIPLESTRVVKATFRLKFRHEGSGRPPVLTFDVSTPDSSNLKSKPDEQRVVAERCLKRWGVSHDDE